VEALEAKIADPSLASADSQDSKGKKRRASVVAKEKEKEEVTKRENQANLSVLKDELNACQKEIKELKESLEEEEGKKADRVMFQEWLDLNDELRELAVDFLYDTIDIEDMEEVIGTYPNICKDEEQRMEKVRL
jgi:hypothetical protein